MLALALLIVGAALVVAGTAALDPTAAVIVAGLLALAAGVDLSRP